MKESEDTDLESTNTAVPPAVENESPWSEQLPEEVLIHILAYALRDVGPVPLLCRTAQVCRYWRDVSYQKDFWIRVDLSSGWVHKHTDGIRELAETRFGDYTKAVNLEAWFKLTDEHLNILCENCIRLEELDLSSCHTLSGEALHIIADRLPHLNSIRLPNMTPLVLGSLPYFLKTRGSTLARFALSNNDVDRNFQATFSTLPKLCPNLTHLEMEHVVMRNQEPLVFNMTAFQSGCSKLTILNLMGTLVRWTQVEIEQAAVPGFLDLEEFHAPEESTSSLGESYIANLLKSSFKLKTLVIKQHALVDLQLVPAVNLECLRLPTDLKNPETFKHIKWKHSLKCLDCSWMSEISRIKLDAALKELFAQQTEFAKLKEISLCGTKISWHGLCSVLEGCRKLTLLNCTLCPNLPRFWARELRGDLLRQLYKLVNEGMSVEELKDYKQWDEH